MVLSDDPAKPGPFAPPTCRGLGPDPVRGPPDRGVLPHHEIGHDRTRPAPFGVAGMDETARQADQGDPGVRRHAPVAPGRAVGGQQRRAAPQQDGLRVPGPAAAQREMEPDVGRLALKAAGCHELGEKAAGPVLPAGLALEVVENAPRSLASSGSVKRAGRCSAAPCPPPAAAESRRRSHGSGRTIAPPAPGEGAGGHGRSRWRPDHGTGCCHRHARPRPRGSGPSGRLNCARQPRDRARRCRAG